MLGDESGAKTRGKNRTLRIEGCGLPAVGRHPLALYSLGRHDLGARAAGGEILRFDFGGAKDESIVLRGRVCLVAVHRRGRGPDGQNPAGSAGFPFQTEGFTGEKRHVVFRKGLFGKGLFGKGRMGPKSLRFRAKKNGGRT